MTGSFEASRRLAQVASSVAAWALAIVPGGPEVCFDQKMSAAPFAFNSQQAVVANDFSRNRPVRLDAKPFWSKNDLIQGQIKCGRLQRIGFP